MLCAFIRGFWHIGGDLVPVGWGSGHPPGGRVKRFTAEKIKKTTNNKITVDNKNLVCYINLRTNRGEQTKMTKTAGQIAREALDASGISQKRLAEKMGLKTQQAVFNLLKAKNGMRVDNFVKMMNLLGYDVVVRNKVTDEEMLVSSEGSDAE